MKQLVNELHPVGTILGATATNVAKAKAAKLAQTKLKKPVNKTQGQQSTTGAVNPQQKVQGVGRNPNLQLSHNEATLLQAEVLWEIKKIHALKEESAAGEIPGIEGEGGTPPTRKERRAAEKAAKKAAEKEAKKKAEEKFKKLKPQYKLKGQLKREEDIARKGGRAAIRRKEIGTGLAKTAKVGVKAASTLGAGALVGTGYAAKGAGKVVGGAAKGAGRAVGGAAGGAGRAIGGTAKGAGRVVGGTARLAGDIVKGTGEVTKGGLQGAGQAIGGLTRGTLGASRGLAGRAAGGIKKVGSTFARAAYRGGRYH